MSLKEILQSIVDSGDSILLSDRRRDWEAGDLLNTLSSSSLNNRAHFQPGLYIAEISSSGYLGQVLYRIKPK
jgi:hypothetical protein